MFVYIIIGVALLLYNVVYYVKSGTRTLKSIVCSLGNWFAALFVVVLWPIALMLGVHAINKDSI